MADKQEKNETIGKIVGCVAQILMSPITITAMVIGETEGLLKATTSLLKSVTKLASTAYGMASRILFGDISGAIEEKADKILDVAANAV